MTARSARRRRARRLIIVGLLLIMIGVLLALSLSVSTAPAAEPGDEREDLTLIVVALIGAIPGTITAVTGLVLALRVGNRAQPTSTTSSD